MNAFRCIFNHEVRKSVQDRKVLASVFLMPVLFVLLTSLLFQTIQSEAKASRIFVLDQDIPLQHSEQVEILVAGEKSMEALREKKVLKQTDVVVKRDSDGLIIYYFSLNSISANTANWCKEVLYARSLEELIEEKEADAAMGIQLEEVQPECAGTNSATALMLPFLLVMSLMQATSEYATESIAGEKERGVFGKVILTPNNPTQLLLGKLLSCAVFSFAGVVMYALAAWGASKVMDRDIYGLRILKMRPEMGALWLLCLIVLCCFFASLFVWASLYSNTEKEARAISLPVVGAVLVIVIAAALHNGATPRILYFIPLYNFFMLLKNMGTSQGFLCDLIITLLSLGGWTAIFFFAAKKTIQREEAWG